MKAIEFKSKNKRERVSKFCCSALRWLFLLLLYLKCMLLSAQTPVLNISMKNVSLHEILMEIKKQSGKDFIYNNNLTDKFNNQTIDLKDATTEDVLKKVLGGKNLTYKIVDNVIIIEPNVLKQNPDIFKKTIIEGIVSDSLNRPIPFASVYLSKTTIGVITNKEGVYSLNIPQQGVYEMVTSFIGYKLHSQIVYAEGKKQTINIKLLENIYSLSEVTISAKDKNRRKNYSQFIISFFGETSNSQNCKIVNPEDLHLYRDSENNTLKGYSLKPLEVENKALGYTILYDLVDFIYYYDTRITSYSGYHHFQPLRGTGKRNNIWEHNRLVAYYGSKMHFLRALFLDSLSRESFKLFEGRFDPVKKEYSGFMPVSVNSIRYFSNRNYVSFFYNNTLLIRYTNNHPGFAPEQLTTQPQSTVSNYVRIPVTIPEDFQSTVKPISKPIYSKPNEYNSIVCFSDTVKIYQNGYYYKPYSIIWKGEMALQRIADMLPDDFQPYEKVIDKADVITNKGHIPLLDSIKPGLSKVAEKVYLHVDREYYNSNDDIWFKAYLIDASTNLPAAGLTNLHVELIASDSKIIQSRIVKIENGIGNGDFRLTDSILSGRYMIRA